MFPRKWNHKLDLNDIWHNDDMDVPAKAAAVAKRIETSAWYDEHDLELWCIVDELKAVAEDPELSESEAIDYFDGVWNNFYDWADGERLWIDVHTPPKAT